ncbi:MAG: hypothetical protein U0800_23005 [Isosphaeraceae bacterium]
MKTKTIPISQAMIFIAVFAVNLCVVRSIAAWVWVAPTAWLYLGIVDFIILRMFVWPGPFRTFHLTALIALAGFYPITLWLIGTDWFLPLRRFAEWIYQPTGAGTSSPWHYWVLEALQLWVMCPFHLATAFAVGWLGSLLERRWGWNGLWYAGGAIHSFWLGLILLGAVQLALKSGLVPPPHAVFFIAFVATCPIIGGLVGLYWANERRKAMQPPESSPEPMRTGSSP